MIAYEWTNPPGWLYALSYMISGMIVCSFFKNRYTRLKKTGIELGIGLALIFQMRFTAPKEFFFPVMLLMASFIVAMVYFSCDMSVTNAVYYAAVIFLLGEFAGSWEWQMVYFVQENEIAFGTIEKTVIFVCCYIGSFVLIFFICRKIYKTEIEIQISRKEIIPVLFITVIVFALSNVSYSSLTTPFSMQLPAEILNVHTLMDLGGIAILITNHVMISEVYMRREVENMQNILNMQYTDYQISQRSVELVEQKYHDLKHQIALLRSSFGTEEALKYLNMMQREVEIFEAQNKTGNRILDTVLTGKSLQCQEKGIKLTCVADGGALDFMEVLDISALFGNALDNAMESVQKLKNPEKRLIHLTVTRQKKFLRIRVENCYDGEIVFENNLPRTTKADKGLHGYGLKSIQSTVQKYNGSVTIQAKDGWFELRILIPLPFEK